MAIRRKSDADRPANICNYAEQMKHERNNQVVHELRQQENPDHGPWSSCWCCCEDCHDLEFIYVGMWPPAWATTKAGEPRSTKANSAASPG